MFEGLKGKRLLWLGGIPRAAYVIRRAKSLGVYVIVADLDETNPGKEIADEAYLIDAMDVDALLELCKRRSIDGIMTGYCDILLPSCYEVAKRMNLPCYMTEDMILASTDKGFFKSLCNRYDVPVPTTYVIDKNELENEAKRLDYPVFIKPLDASGSRGADVCEREEDFVEKYNYALSFSKKGDVVVEEFLSGTEFILDYIIIDGMPHFLSMTDRYVIDGRGAAINSPNLQLVPSKNIERYISTVDEKVKNMFVNAGFKNGLIFLQGYASDKKIAFYEMGCRLGGTWPYIDEYYTGINPMDMLFNHTLTNRMLPDGVNVDINPRFNGKAAIIYFLSDRPEGKIAKMEGVKEIEDLPWVVDVMQFYNESDYFDMSRQTDVRFLSVHLVASDREELNARVNEVYSMFKVYDESGDNLLSNLVDMDSL